MSISAPHFFVSLALGALVGFLVTLFAYLAWRRWRRPRSIDHASAKLTGFEQIIPGPAPPAEHPAVVPLEDSKDVQDLQATNNAFHAKDLEKCLDKNEESARDWTEELEAAIDAKDLRRLDNVLTEARKSNTCSRGLLDRGAQLLAELHLRAELEAALREAMKEKNLQALQQNVHAAQAMQTFPTKLLEDASRMLEELQKQLQAESSSQRCEDLETALRAAMIEGDLEALENLFAESSQHGVNKEVLQRAASQIEQLRRKTKLENALRDAMDSGDLDKLLELLSQCLHDPVSFDIIEQAEAVVAALQRNKEIEINLQTAIDNDDMDGIRRLLVSAKQAHISRLLIEKAENVLADYHEVEMHVRASIKERNLVSLKKCIRLVQAKNRFSTLLEDAKQSEAAILKESIDIEITAAVAAKDYPLLCELVIRAEALKLESPGVTAAAELLSKHLKRESIEVSWNLGDEAIPWDESSCSSDLNPTVEISIRGNTPGMHEVQCFLEDVDCAAVQSAAAYGDQIHGFVLLANPHAHSSCPTLIPGGPVLASAACDEQGVACAKLELSTGTKIFLGSGEGTTRKVFAVASLLGPVVHGGRARFHFWAAVDLCVKLLPSLHERWAYQMSLGGQWLLPSSSAGGPISDEGAWLSNPQFQVSLEQPGPLQLAAVLNVRACPCKAYLHVVQGEGSSSYLAPRSIEILAQGTHKTFEDVQEIVVYIEIEDSTGPFFLVPSLKYPGKGASFDLQVLSNAKLQVQQVRSDLQAFRRPEGLDGSLSHASAERLHGALPANEDGRLDKIKVIFSREDSTGKGTLDMLEFESLIRKLAEVQGASLDDDDIEAMFDQCDANGDGTVDFLEFANWAIASGLQETGAAVKDDEEV
eukprot:TRINITY_DN73095_c0_g1_i1.p1 TRINITY_DN73095_c0_g1~~TRINITY_DN73095_c0_g1_i1.p1  ORF type:complete len:874 (+),score=176.74 TRINITY_DN73095_c0_g1_i1:83-2704(+)